MTIRPGIFAIIAIILLAGCVVGFAHYQVENGKWAYVEYNEGYGRMVVPVDRADSSSFRQLDDPLFAVDRFRAYRHGYVIAVADGKTFRHLIGPYWRDAKHLFFDSDSIDGADPESFRPYPVGQWGRDSSNVFAGRWVFRVEDINSFAPIDETWGKDSKGFYARYADGKIARVHCDYSTFTTLQWSYAKDKNTAFFLDHEIPGSDSATFHVVGVVQAADKNNKYRGVQVYAPNRP